MMKGMDVHDLRRTFDGAAELYDRVRPRYPVELFDDLANMAELRSGTRVLEIGCGTGQATAPLAVRGYQIQALDLGPSLTRLARRNLGAFPNVEVITSSFEAWTLPPEPFDAVVSATAFHWVDQAVRVEKAADALRDGGTLAIITTHHVAGGSQAFFDAVQACYERWDPATPPGLRLMPAADIPHDAAELEQSGRFGPARFGRYEWEVTYAAARYLDLLRTYSNHRALPSTARRGLLADIKRLIETEFGGVVTKRYLAELRVAARTA